MVSTSGVELFLKDLRRKCRDHKVKLNLVRANQVKCEGEIRCSGYFEPGDLSVAKGQEDWLQTLVHESCHLDQWVENSKEWQREDKLGNGVLDDWILGKDIDRRRVRRAINNIIALEVDCERRAIAKIIEYELPISETIYIQRANCYLLYYNHVFETRRWYEKEPPYIKPGLYSIMPKRLMSLRWYRKMSDKVRKIFIEQGL